jgi:hypothetical protein
MLRLTPVFLVPGQVTTLFSTARDQVPVPIMLLVTLQLEPVVIVVHPQELYLLLS